MLAVHAPRTTGGGGDRHHRESARGGQQRAGGASMGGALPAQHRQGQGRECRLQRGKGEEGCFFDVAATRSGCRVLVDVSLSIESPVARRCRGRNPQGVMNINSARVGQAKDE